MSTSIGFLLEQVEQAITRTCTYLFSVQQLNGSWQDHISSSVIATPVVLCVLYHADRQRFATILREGCVWLRETQHVDGGWGDAVVDASTLNATAMAVAALKLIDPEDSISAIEHALAYLDSRGGFAAVANPKECSMSLACLTLLAFAGLYPWEKIRRVPLYLILLPRRFWWPYSIALPSIFSWGLIHDRKLTTNLLRRWLNQLAKPKVLKWIESTRGTNGSWEDCPMVTGTVSLAHVLCGMPAEHVAPGLSYLLATRRVDGSWAFLESIGHSVTTYILDGFEKVGMSDHPCVKTARDWLLASYHDEPFAPLGFPGGWWSWTVPANWADIEDTAGAITVLLRSGVSASHPYVRKACDSLCKLQNRDGSWPTYVKDAHTPVDKPCPGVTVGVVLALHSCCDAPERARYLSAIDRALAYLPRAQRSDGGLHSQWFSQVYSVGQVLGAYAMLSRANEPVARKCRAWLLEHQHVDGSWSEDADQAGTVEDTAWALNALATLGVDAPDEALDRAATWLVQRQNCDGSWPPSPVCGYSIGGRYSDDHVANGFALQALGRYRRLRKEHT